MVEWKEVESGGFWHPEEGDELIGTLVNTRDSKYGEMYDIDKGDDHIVTVSSWAILKKKMAKVTIGTKVKIVFKGVIPTVNGVAKDFDVFVEA